MCFKAGILDDLVCCVQRVAEELSRDGPVSICGNLLWCLCRAGGWAVLHGVRISARCVDSHEIEPVQALNSVKRRNFFDERMTT